MNQIVLPVRVFERLSLPEGTCARTGRPATKAIKGQAKRHMKWWHPLLLVIPALTPVWVLPVEHGTVTYRLPASRGTRWRRELSQVALALLLMSLAFTLLWPLMYPGPVSVGVFVLNVVLVVASARSYLDAWVRVRLRGDEIVLDGLSPEYAAALHAEIERFRAATTPAPAPAPAVASGWYPDPSGDPGLRWWDGAAWTTHVHPAAG